MVRENKAIPASCSLVDITARLRAEIAPLLDALTDIRHDANATRRGVETKAAGAEARRSPVRTEPRAVRTGRTVAELAAEARR